MISPRRRLPGGFTLIEVFVVMAILAILGAMGWQATKMIRTRQMNKTAEIQVAQMEVGMNNYRMDSGDVLPAASGDVWSSHVLYTALYCDEDGDGEPDIDEATQELRMPYCEAITPMVDLKKASEMLNGIPAIKVRTKPTNSKKKASKCFVIIDPWGNPFRYRLGFSMKDEKGKNGKGVNPDFDIFSQGADGLGNGLNNVDDNEDNISNVRTWN